MSNTLPISSLLTYSSSYSFLCNIFFCHLILSNFLCSWSLFLRLQDYNSSWFWFLSPSKWGSSKEACACFLVGRAGFHPSGGQGCVKGCVYRRLLAQDNFRCLSPDWWGCVLTLLVVWPEAFHHWNLQAVRWGKILVPKWQPPGKLTLMRIPWVSTISVLVPRVSHSLPLSPSGGPPRPTGRSGPHSYGVIAVPLVPVHTKQCLCPPRVASVSPSPVEPLYSRSTGLQSQTALRAPPPDTRPAGWGVWRRTLSSHSCAGTPVIKLFSSLWVAHQRDGISSYHESAPPTIFLWLLFCICG